MSKKNSPEVTIKFLGGAGTVTGSKTIVQCGDERVLIDCGMFQGIKDLRKRNWEEFPDLDQLDAVVLTHAHLDHCGLVPRLVRQGFRGPVYCTPITARLVRIIWQDSAKIQMEDAEKANQEGYSRHKPAQPLYDTHDVEKSLPLLRKVDFKKPFTTEKAGLTLEFISNGHIPGSAMVYCQTSRYRLVFSGDLGRSKPLIMAQPEPLPACDLLVLESTYGDRTHPEESPFDQMEYLIKEALAEKGQILIPSFALERAQEIMYILLRLMRDKRLPLLKMYLDSPMAASVTAELMDYFPFLRDPEFRAIREKSIQVVSDHQASRAVVAMPGPKVVIAGSGMITGGRILHHMEAHLSKKSTMVILPGYQAPGTRGYSLARGEKEIKFFGKYHRVNARIERIDGLSAHADRQELVDWVKNGASLPGRVILNHGEPHAVNSLRVKLEHELGIPVQAAVDGLEMALP